MDGYVMGISTIWKPMLFATIGKPNGFEMPGQNGRVSAMPAAAHPPARQ
jgi:hypothetical protein